MTQNYERRRGLGSAAILSGEQRILFIFVDDDGADHWTHKLRQTVEESATRSLRWLESQALLNNIKLHFQHTFAPAGSLPGWDAECRIAEGLVKNVDHSTWQNTVVKKMTEFHTVSEGWESLFNNIGLSIAGTDGSAIFFVVRRLVCSIAFPFYSGQADEFRMERGIIYDNGGEGVQIYLDSLIAHETLHLYGAADLKLGKDPGNVPDQFCQNPDEVMHTPTQHDIVGYHISELTAYLVGWRNSNPDSTT